MIVSLLACVAPGDVPFDTSWALVWSDSFEGAAGTAPEGLDEIEHDATLPRLPAAPISLIGTEASQMSRLLQDELARSAGTNVVPLTA